MRALRELRNIAIASHDMQANLMLEHWISNHVREIGSSFEISSFVMNREGAPDFEYLKQYHRTAIGKQLSDFILNNTTEEETKNDWGTSFRRRIWLLTEERIK